MWDRTKRASSCLKMVENGQKLWKKCEKYIEKCEESIETVENIGQFFTPPARIVRNEQSAQFLVFSS
jgi:hypothetical protein